MDCLVTKLKGAVNDDTLSQLGVLHLFQPYVKSESNDYIFMRLIAGDKPITVRTDGTLKVHGFSTDASSLLIEANHAEEFHVVNKVGGSNIWIDGVYDIKYLQLGSQLFYSQREYDVLGYVKLLRGLFIGQSPTVETTVTLDANDLQNAWFISIPNEYTISNIRKLLDNKDIISLRLSAEKSQNFTMDDFQNFNNLQELYNVPGNFSKLPKSIRLYTQTESSTYTGSVEDFVANQRSAGRTSGAVKLVWMKYFKGITFEGKILQTWWSEKGYSENDGFISWGSSITVTNVQPESYVAPDSYNVLL